jgi:hypothetical protein
MVALVGYGRAFGWWGMDPTFPFSTSNRVWARFPKVAADGTLWYHTSSIPVALLGDLAKGLIAAMLLGYGEAD